MTLVQKVYSFNKKWRTSHAATSGGQGLYCLSIHFKETVFCLDFPLLTVWKFRFRPKYHSLNNLLVPNAHIQSTNKQLSFNEAWSSFLFPKQGVQNCYVYVFRVYRNVFNGSWIDMTLWCASRFCGGSGKGKLPQVLRLCLSFSWLTSSFSIMWVRCLFPSTFPI